LRLKALNLHRAGKLDEAELLYKKVLKNIPTDFVSLYSLGVILLKIGNPHEVLEYIDRAIKVNPRFSLAWDCRGSALMALSRNNEALESYDRAIKIDAKCVIALLHRGILLGNLGFLDAALESCDRLLKINPKDKEALNNKGLHHINLKQYDEALLTFERLLQIDPDYIYALGSFCYVQQLTCKWDQMDACIKKILDGVATGKHRCNPPGIISMSDSPHLNQLGAQMGAQLKYPPQASLWQGERYVHDKIRIAYISPDLNEHPVSHLMSGIFENHDKSRFEITAISLGRDDNSWIRRRIETSFDKLIEVRHLSSRTIAELIRSMEIDIAVDLAGYTFGARPDIFSHRPAPVQVNYLGYPGTMGATYMDYMLADRQVIPESDRQFYTEKVVYLPDSYLPNDTSLKISDRTPTREECGLPPEGFVFCSFNHSKKITPEMFDVWMRLLRETPDSVLWLMKLNIYAEQNLQKEARIRGVEPDRLVFATRVPDIGDHLARYRLADLFLDSSPYNAHTTACDALFVGLPVLTYQSQAFPGRVAGGLLHVIGLPELITSSLQEYENLALKLTRDRALLEGMKRKLELNRETSPLFDTKRFCRNLESAYITMWERQQKGEQPKSFAVPQQSADTKALLSNPEMFTALEVADDVNSGMSRDQKLTQALSFQNKGELHKAEAIFRQLLTESPNDVVPLYSLGVIALSLGEQEKSLKYLDLAAEQAPGFQQTWFNRGLVLQSLGRHSEALASYNKALVIDPAYSQAEANWNALSVAISGGKSEFASTTPLKTLEEMRMKALTLQDNDQSAGPESFAVAGEGFTNKIPHAPTLQSGVTTAEERICSDTRETTENRKPIVAILIPIYKDALDSSEQFAIDYLVKNAPGREKFFIAPRSLNQNYYRQRYSAIEFRLFEDSYFISIKCYNHLLLNVDFYMNFSSFDYILIHQPDALMFHDDLDYWMERGFDYVGAPWPNGVEVKMLLGKFAVRDGLNLKAYVGNGGFSLRSIKGSIAVLQEFEDIRAHWIKSLSSEDLFFAYMGMVSDKFTIPNQVIASRFSLEADPEKYYEINGLKIPTGSHAGWKVFREFWEKVGAIRKRE